MVTLEEEALQEGLKAALNGAHNLAEGAGAASLAAARKFAPTPRATVVCVMSGGNADMRVLRRVLA